MNTAATTVSHPDPSGFASAVRLAAGALRTRLGRRVYSRDELADLIARRRIADHALDAHDRSVAHARIAVTRVW